MPEPEPEDAQELVPAGPAAAAGQTGADAAPASDVATHRGGAPPQSHAAALRAQASPNMGYDSMLCGHGHYKMNGVCLQLAAFVASV